MLCPECGADSKVTDSRPSHRSIRRRRECLACHYRWTTFEVVHAEGMEPYPMCKADGCHKHKDPKSPWAMCKLHTRKKDGERRSREGYKAKHRQREKLKRMRRSKA
jgi:hypothetical protein